MMAQSTQHADTPDRQVEGGGATTAVAPAKPKPVNKPKLLPPFKVLLHNDEVNDFEHVIRCIMRLTGLTIEDAVKKTLEAHETGVALLLVTHRERAELYCEQFATYKLMVTTEPDA